MRGRDADGGGVVRDGHRRGRDEEALIASAGASPTIPPRPPSAGGRGEFHTAGRRGRAPRAGPCGRSPPPPEVSKEKGGPRPGGRGVQIRATGRARTAARWSTRGQARDMGSSLRPSRSRSRSPASRPRRLKGPWPTGSAARGSRRPASPAGAGGGQPLKARDAGCPRSRQRPERAKSGRDEEPTPRGGDLFGRSRPPGADYRSRLSTAFNGAALAAPQRSSVSGLGLVGPDIQRGSSSAMARRDGPERRDRARASRGRAPRCPRTAARADSPAASPLRNRTRRAAARGPRAAIRVRGRRNPPGGLRVPTRREQVVDAHRARVPSGSGSRRPRRNSHPRRGVPPAPREEGR